MLRFSEVGYEEMLADGKPIHIFFTTDIVTSCPSDGVPRVQPDGLHFYEDS